MKEEIKAWKQKARTRGTFLRNLIFTFSSNAIIYGINLLFYPLITYLFSPASYAEFAIWNLLVNNLIIIGALGYTDSLVIAKSQKEYFLLSSAIACLMIILTFFLMVLFLILQKSFWSTFDSNPFDWIFLAFPVALMINARSILYTGNIRLNLLERSAKVNTYLKLISKMVVIILGWLGASNGLGLVAGDIVFSFLILFFILPTDQISRYWRSLKKIEISRYLQVLKTNLDYPRYVFPTLWVVILIQQLPVWIVGFQFSTDQLGLYSFCLGILSIPVSMFTNSIRPVFFKKNIEFKSLTDLERRTKVSKLIKWMVFALPLYNIFGFLGIDLFYDYLFAEKWEGGEELMKTMIIGIGGILLGSPMASIFKVNNNLRVDLIVRLLSLLTMCLGCYLLVIFGVDFLRFSLAFNCMYFLSFLILFVFQLREFDYKTREILKVLSQVGLAMSTSVIGILGIIWLFD
ncbi:MAG: oligosaccharide flippase family protein [Cyclobacteriaceae bacterium]